MSYVEIPVTKKFSWREYSDHMEMWQNIGTFAIPNWKMVFSTISYTTANLAPLATTTGTTVGSINPSTGTNQLLGYHGSYTPSRSGYCVVIGTFYTQTTGSANASGTFLINMVAGTGAYPGAGATSFSGTSIEDTDVPFYNSTTIPGLGGVITLVGFIQLTVGTAYWFDVAVAGDPGYVAFGAGLPMYTIIEF